jgi:hypothetical protein
VKRQLKARRTNRALTEWTPGGRRSERALRGPELRSRRGGFLPWLDEFMARREESGVCRTPILNPQPVVSASIRPGRRIDAKENP